MKTVTVALQVNDKRYERTIEPRMTLGDFLRHEIGLTGTHLGCEHGVCGACTVLFDGKSVRSCLMFAPQAQGAQILTVESLAENDGRLHPLQQAFRDQHALQCGFCTPGMLMTIIELIKKNPRPTEPEIREAISGNLCRCTGYQAIVAATLQFSAQRQGEAL